MSTGPSFGFAVVPASVDRLYAVQHLDLLAEFTGQRPGGLLGFRHRRGVDAVVVVAATGVPPAGPALALGGEAGAGQPVSIPAGVGLRLCVSDKGQGDAARLRLSAAGTDDYRCGEHRRRLPDHAAVAHGDSLPCPRRPWKGLRWLGAEKALNFPPKHSSEGPRMAIDPSAVGAVTEPMLFEWTDRDTMLYALGVGCGTEDLSFTTENSHDIAQQVLPTYAVICCPAFGAAGRSESSTGPCSYTDRNLSGCMPHFPRRESCRWSPRSPTSRTRARARTPS